MKVITGNMNSRWKKFLQKVSLLCMQCSIKSSFCSVVNGYMYIMCDGDFGRERVLTRMDTPKSVIRWEIGTHFCILCYPHARRNKS